MGVTVKSASEPVENQASKWFTLLNDRLDCESERRTQLVYLNCPSRPLSTPEPLDWDISSVESPLLTVFEPKVIEPKTALAHQLLMFKRASESLERSRRVRVNRLIVDWEESSSVLRPSRRSRFLAIADRLLRRKRQRQSTSFDFDAFLLAAHHHEAVARRSTESSRRWFDDWRRQALAALRLGLSPRTLLALLRSASIARSSRTATKRPSRQADADSARFRERLENVIFPNAPGAAGSPRYFAA